VPFAANLLLFAGVVIVLIVMLLQRGLPAE
jgi:hypothetical protein